MSKRKNRLPNMDELLSPDTSLDVNDEPKMESPVQPSPPVQVQATAPPPPAPNPVDVDDKEQTYFNLPGDVIARFEMARVGANRLVKSTGRRRKVTKSRLAEAFLIYGLNEFDRGGANSETLKMLLRIIDSD